MDLRWAGEVLAGQQQPPPESLRPEVALALVDELVARTEADALAWLAQLGQAKKLAKLARTGVHRLRTRKVDVALPPPSATGELHQPGRADVGASRSASVATIYDGRDERLVWLVEPGTTKGLMLAQGRMSARYGLLDCEVGSVGRKAYREIIRDLKRKVMTVEVDGQTARWLVDDAARRAEAAGRTPPRDYLHLRREFGAKVTGEHPALSIAPVELSDGRELLMLLQHPALVGWTPDRSSTRQLTLRLQEIATSQLMVNDEQRGQQVEHAIQRWCDEYLTDERRAAHRQLLLDTAQLLAAADDEQGAALARAAADACGPGDASGERAPYDSLMRGLIERSMPDLRALLGEATAEQQQAAAAADDKVSGGGLIIP